MSLTVKKDYFLFNDKMLTRRYDKNGVPRCSKHNEYKAVKFPTTGCIHCISKWDAVHGTNELGKLHSPPKKKKSKSKPKKKVVLKNKIAICLDRSGSMYVFGNTVKNKLVETVRSIQAESKRTGQETTLTLIQFDSYVETVFFDVPIDKAVQLVDSYRYNLGGMTALLSAVNEAIDKFLSLEAANDKNTSFLVMSLTDGYENSSRISPHQLNQKIDQVVKTDRWSFAFQLPSGHKENFCRSFSVPEGNVMEWETTVRGLETAAKSTIASTSAYFNTRSTGQTKTNSFYVTDLSNIKQSDVKKLSNIAKKVRVFTVEKECEIRDFCEEKTSEYRNGHAFYQLTKSETKVQPYKKILIMEKGKKAVYSGDDARQLLGLPVDKVVKVKPGNHANFDVFIQSTSYNRKLVRGTKVVYLKEIPTL